MCLSPGTLPSEPSLRALAREIHPLRPRALQQARPEAAMACAIARYRQGQCHQWVGSGSSLPGPTPAGGALITATPGPWFSVSADHTVSAKG
jgi:hypothetical protein